ncbi:MAG: divergent polysaccharide deacetylase family protein [Treponema sp.]|nr:divergent polysaccharide deacetylase family protein [Treponema sp.]
MIEKSPAPKRSSTKKRVSPKKRTATRKTSSKAKKPKVILAKNKVALLCGLICGICVLAIGVNIALNQSSEIKSQKSENVTKMPQIAQNTEVQKEKSEARTQKAQTQQQPKKSDAAPSAKTEAKPQKTQVTEQPKKAEEKKEKTEVKNKKINTQAVVKTIPQSQTSQAGSAASGKTQSAQPVQKLQTNQNSQVASVLPPKQQEQIQQNIPKNRFDIPPASNGATIVIIIDDAGRSVENTKRYTALPFPITIAVLPKLPQSRACADAIRSAGKEVILHQPMQSLNHNLDPGPGKITSEMTTYEIAQIVKQNLLELGPGVRGMNNHEGSDVTSNEIKIGAVLEVCAEMGVYFLDSRTTAATKAPQAALERDMHIFEKAGPYLDNDIDRTKMLERMRETLAYANRHGRAIVIGHVDKSVNILPDLLAEMYPEMKAAGYRFATPSMLK